MSAWVRCLIAAVTLLGTLAAGLSPAAGATLPPIHHVYTIVLENQSVSTTFGPNSPAPYLSRTLRAQGAYLPRYYGVGHESNDNYIAMISGQAPNALTQADCQYFTDFVGGTMGSYGQEQGTGCVYPANVPTVAGQLQAAGLTWRDYNDGMGADPKRETSVCGHPALGSQDQTQSATAKDQYAARHNPFVYFHAIIDDTTLCDTHVVNLDSLAQDLAAPQSPNYVFITPNLCNDGHDATCAGGGPGGLARVDQFLRQWVPQITGSRAFRQDGGLLMIIFDESDSSDTGACCGEIAGPGSPRPGITGPGGGDTGAILLSPYIHGGTVSQQPYNHYTALRSIEDLFGLAHLGYAQLPGESTFGRDVFACAPSAPPVAHQGLLPAGSEFRGPRFLRRGLRTPQLKLYSVGASSLRVTITRPGRRPIVLRRALSPCRLYFLKLPRGRGWRVRLAAAAAGGVQRAALRY